MKDWVIARRRCTSSQKLHAFGFGSWRARDKHFAHVEPYPCKIGICSCATLHSHPGFVQSKWERSKSKLCNRTGAHTRDIPRYIENVTGRRLSRQAPPLAVLFLVILSRATSRDKGYVTRPMFHTFVTEGCWRGPSGTGLTHFQMSLRVPSDNLQPIQMQSQSLLLDANALFFTRSECLRCRLFAALVIHALRVHSAFENALIWQRLPSCRHRTSCSCSNTLQLLLRQPRRRCR